MRLVIASRGSRLAVAQTETVAGLLRAHRPDIEVGIKPIRTTGDRDARPFAQIGGKGLFTSEVERAVAEERADVAVHSAKDLTAAVADGCTIVCVPPRASVHDVVVGGEGATGEERLASLRAGATVGTSSMRRRALLAEARPDLTAAEFRGNLDTRLARISASEVDVAVVAMAGIERLGAVAGARPAPLDPGWWVPPPGQGALAVEARTDREDLAELFGSIEDPGARAELSCERAFSGRLEGGCSIPLGCRAVASGDRLIVTGYLGHPGGSMAIRDRISGGLEDAADLGAELAAAILGAGGDDILDELRPADAPEIPEP